MLIAQLTDTHIRVPGALAYRQVDTAELLQRAVLRLATLVPRPDAVIVTGDLTDFDEADEYARFRHLVRPLGMPLWPIPGNHDSSEGIRRAFPELAPQLMRSDLCYTVDTGPVRLVMLDSTVPGAPHGLLSASRLGWLDATLGAQPDAPTLLALHHPPFRTGIRHMDLQNCRGGDELARIIERYPQVLAVVCGHVHRAVVTRFAGRMASIGPAPAHAVTLDLDPDGPPAFHLEPPSLHLHLWRASGEPYGSLVTHQLFIDPGRGPFPFFDAQGQLVR